MFSLHRQLFFFSRPYPNQKFFFLFGAPGVGKGTYGRMLQKDLGLRHISSGYQIRKILKNPQSSNLDTDLIREVVRSGGLVSDEDVFEIISKKIRQPESRKGIILDGFPRTMNQLNVFLTHYPLDGVLNITLREDILYDKMLGRRVCVGCHKSYNLCNIDRDGYDMQPMLPKVDGVCDNCGSKLFKRQDDHKNIIHARLEEYRVKAMPLLKIFDNMDVLLNIEPKRGIKDYEQLRQLVISKLFKE